MLQVIHMSDTHFAADPEYRFGGFARPRGRVEAVVAAIGALEFKPDLIVHTGDVTEDGLRESYDEAAEVLGRLGAPIYFVPGNHDDGELLREVLGPREVTWLTGNEREHAYMLEYSGHRLIMLDGMAGEGWTISPEQLEGLENVLNGEGGPVTVWLHFPALPVGCPWVDEEMLLGNGAALHEVLKKAGPERVRGVFSGHVHRGVKMTRDGIFYCAVGSACAQIRIGPEDVRPAFEGGAPLWFNHVAIGEADVVVREFSVAVP
jgi:Icc protein